MAPRGRLVTPDPRLEDYYRSLGASTTHCEVTVWGVGVFACRSIDELSDDRRHRDDTGEIVACRSCVQVVSGRPVAAERNVAPRSVQAARLLALARELAEIAREIDDAGAGRG